MTLQSRLCSITLHNAHHVVPTMVARPPACSPALLPGPPVHPLCSLTLLLFQLRRHAAHVRPAAAPPLALALGDAQPWGERSWENKFGWLL